MPDCPASADRSPTSGAGQTTAGPIHDRAVWVSRKLRPPWGQPASSAAPAAPALPAKGLTSCRSVSLVRHEPLRFFVRQRVDFRDDVLFEIGRASCRERV